MEKERLFTYINEIEVPQLRNLLDFAFDTMTVEQRYKVFGQMMDDVPEYHIEGRDLITKINQFCKDSHNGNYYAPFDINSKNYMNIPEETEQWFDTLSNYLDSSRILSDQGDHGNAVECFHKLYELIDDMCSGDCEMIFADEYGTWMITVDEVSCIKAFFKSLAKVATPANFARFSAPVIERDSCESFTKKAYELALAVVNHEQKMALLDEIKRKKIRTEPRVY